MMVASGKYTLPSPSTIPIARLQLVSPILFSTPTLTSRTPRCFRWLAVVVYAGSVDAFQIRIGVPGRYKSNVESDVRPGECFFCVLTAGMITTHIVSWFSLRLV